MGRRKILETNFSTEQIIYKKIKELKNGICTIDQRTALQVLPSLAVAIGLNEAIILQQIHYWLNPRFNQNYFEGWYWVYNTYEKWQQQFPFWCLKTIKRTISSLENSKVLLSVITRDFKKTKYYTIDYDRLNEISQSSTKTPENLKIPPSGQIDPIDGEK